MQKTPFGGHTISHAQYTFVLLSGCWLTGLLFGLLFAPYAGEIYVSLMRSAPLCSVSIVGLIAVVLVPFLLSAFAVHCKKAGLLLFLCFCKAFMHALCAGGISLAFGNADWLVRFLLLFSDCCTLPLFCWFCFRCLCYGEQYLRQDFLFCLAVLIAVCGFDYMVVSPFLVVLI